MYQQKCQEMDEIPIGWTLFNNGLMSANFHQLKEMGGLCSTVHWLQKNEGECPISCMKERAKNLNHFSYNLKNNNECVSHCMEWCLSND